VAFYVITGRLNKINEYLLKCDIFLRITHLWLIVRNGRLFGQLMTTLDGIGLKLEWQNFGIRTEP